MTETKPPSFNTIIKTDSVNSNNLFSDKLLSLYVLVSNNEKEGIKERTLGGDFGW